MYSPASGTFYLLLSSNIELTVNWLFVTLYSTLHTKKPKERRDKGCYSHLDLTTFPSWVADLSRCKVEVAWAQWSQHNCMGYICVSSSRLRSHYKIILVVVGNILYKYYCVLLNWVFHAFQRNTETIYKTRIWNNVPFNI